MARVYFLMLLYMPKIFSASLWVNFLLAVVRHGYVPKLLKDCILLLIPKPGKDLTCSDNYRPSALAPTLSKVLEWCILLRYGDSFSTSPLQFRFKPGLSADMCTGLIENVISRYCFNGSNVCGCFLDTLKAFDRVSHLKLFSKLLEKDLPPIIISMFFSWYRDQNPQFSGTKLLQSFSQFLMELDKVVSYHPYFLLSILINYWPDWNLKLLVAIGHTILLDTGEPTLMPIKCALTLRCQTISTSEQKTQWWSLLHEHLLIITPIYYLNIISFIHINLFLHLLWWVQWNN